MLGHSLMAHTFGAPLQIASLDEVDALGTYPQLESAPGRRTQMFDQRPGG